MKTMDLKMRIRYDLSNTLMEKIKLEIADFKNITRISKSKCEEFLAFVELLIQKSDTRL